jgi:predicted nucleic acid-binding protein
VTLVVDASVMLTRALGELNPTAALTRERLQGERAFVPALWWFELRNVLVVNERRGRISETDTSAALVDWARLDITIDRSPDEAIIMTLARRHRLTVYDAAYLELALREGADLATLDASLAEAAQREGVALVGGTV